MCFQLASQGRDTTEEPSQETQKGFHGSLGTPAVQTLGSADSPPEVHPSIRFPQGSRLARWAMALQGFNIEIVLRKGGLHSNADYLSRPVNAFFVL